MDTAREMTQTLRQMFYHTRRSQLLPGQNIIIHSKVEQVHRTQGRYYAEK